MSRHSMIALATAAMCALAFAPATTPSSDQPSGAASEPSARNALGGMELRVDASGTADRSAFTADLGGVREGESPMALPVRRAGIQRMLADAGADVLVGEMCADGCGEPDGGDGGDGSFSYSYTDVRGVGDLTGDGYSDIAEVAYTYSYDGATDEYSETTSMTLRDGSDGSQLWATDGSGFLALVPDLDGDGLGDLASFDSRYDFTEDEGTFSIDETLTITFLRGSDGTALGSMTHDSSWGYSYSGSYTGIGPVGMYEEHDSYFDRGWIMALDLVTDDAGGTSLMMNTVDYDETYDESGIDAGAVQLYDRVMAYATASQVVLMDPLTGDAAALYDSDDDGKLSFVHVLDGDVDSLIVTRVGADDEAYEASCASTVTTVCAGDLTIGEEPVEEEREVQVLVVDLDGSARFEITPTDESYAIVSAEGDVDGDGVADLLDLTYDEDYNDVVDLISGVDGTVLWRAPVVYGVASGDGLIGIELQFSEDSYTELAIAVRGDGTVAERVELSTYEYSEGEEPSEGDSFIDEWTFVSFRPLAGGDVDLLVEREVYEYTYVGEECYEEEGYEWCYEWYEAELLEASLRGYDGHDLSLLTDQDTMGSYVSGTLDLDADGDVELLLQSWGDEESAGALAARRLDGSTVWQLDGYVYALDGLGRPDGGFDVIVEDFERGTIDVRDGRTGAVRLHVVETGHQMYTEVGIVYATS